jgi:PAS domain S-box-containing protein
MNLANFTPHGFCLSWQPGLIWLHASADALTAIAYYSIPAALLLFVRRRRDLAFRPIFALFATFILACGTTHILDVVTLWYPVYWLDGGVKALTAALSMATAVMLWPLLPQAIALPSPAQARLLNDALARQVAERDLAVAELNASRLALRRLYARTPAALHATDAAGIMLEVTDRWLDLFGYERAQVIGRHVTAFYEPGTVRRVQAQLADFQQGGNIQRAERRILRADGEIRDVEATFEPERDASGRLQRVLVALTDVTSRKQAEADLRASEERLRHAQKMEAVGQLTGGIAHDFNNLLTTIIGSLELLKNRGELDARNKRLIANALAGAERGARLTGQLLAFSRRQRLAPTWLMPAEVVAGIRELLARTLGETIMLQVAPADAAQWPVLADRNQLEMALLNLVINARHAIHGSGTVCIDFSNRSLTPAEAETVNTDPLLPGDYVGIVVTDTGAGMTPEVLARACEPFFTTKQAGTGTGLGLSQTYGFASQSGGAVLIESAPGAGTRVEILLPRAVAHNATPSPPSGPAVAGSGETILVVEDDMLLRETVTEALREHGYQVVSAADGAAALLALDVAGHVDVLFTDITMPGPLNGVALARAARARQPALRILFATGYSDGQVLAQWPEQLDLLPKPFTLDELAARIAQTLGAAPLTKQV